MSSSSALYTDPTLSLEQAQQVKQQRIIELLQTQPNQRVLEIGCGWGRLAEQLVRQADRCVTGVTLPPAQPAFAQARTRPPGRQVSSDLRLQDHRDVGGHFDRIVSIEMMEAVGEEYWPSYVQTWHDRLHPGGLAVIQAIAIAEEKFEGHRRCTGFIQQYIFPGGMLPAISKIRCQTKMAGLTLQSMDNFGPSYARTLAEWRTRFHAAWPEIERPGFDAKFRRNGGQVRLRGPSWSSAFLREKIEERASEHAMSTIAVPKQQIPLSRSGGTRKRNITENRALPHHIPPLRAAPPRIPTKRHPHTPQRQRICEYDGSGEILFRPGPSKRNDHRRHHHHSIATTTS